MFSTFGGGQGVPNGVNSKAPKKRSKERLATGNDRVLIRMTGRFFGMYIYIYIHIYTYIYIHAHYSFL